MSDAEWSFASGVVDRSPAPEPPPTVEGGTLGPFLLEEELGRGGMGRVVRARYRGQRYALKLLVHDDARVRARLAREARLVGALQHPGIVRLHGAGTVEGRAFLLYELIDGARPLSSAWQEFSLAQRVELIAQVADAVGYAHARGVVHRDVKPDNVLVDRAGRPRVIDFGLATHEALSGLTQTGAWLGTPSYMAPEQFEHTREQQRPTVDVWSLGVLLYEALTEVLPFHAATVHELGARLLEGPRRTPRALNPEVPRAVEAVCLQALSYDPARRPRDGAAFAAALRAATTPRPARRPGWAVLGGAMALAAAIGAGLWLGRPGGSLPAPPDVRDPFELLIAGGLSGEELLTRARARLALLPRDRSALVAEAVALQELGDYPAAVALAEGVLADAPQDLDALRTLIGCHYRTGRFAEGRAACERALAVDPQSEFALVYASLIAVAAHDEREALTLAERALSHCPDSASAQAVRGMARLGLGDAEGALSDFDAALAREENSDTRVNRAQALLILGRPAEALDELARVEGQAKASQVWLAARLRALALLRPAEAAFEARERLAKEPERADLHYLLGEALEAQGDPQAWEAYATALELDPASRWGQAAARALSRRP
ncbi:MAG: protein kinase [Planctomycetota bacterium]